MFVVHLRDTNMQLSLRVGDKNAHLATSYIYKKFKQTSHFYDLFPL